MAGLVKVALNDSTVESQLLCLRHVSWPIVQKIGVDSAYPFFTVRLIVSSHDRDYQD